MVVVDFSCFLRFILHPSTFYALAMLARRLGCRADTLSGGLKQEVSNLVTGVGDGSEQNHPSREIAFQLLTESSAAARRAARFDL